MDNVTLVKGLYDAFGRGDIPGVLGGLRPDVRWHEAESNPYQPSGEAFVGPDAIVNGLFMRIGAEWESFAIHVKAMYNAGDMVVVEARYVGKYKATGKSLDAQACHVWTVQDGKVAKFQQYVDTAKLRDALTA